MKRFFLILSLFSVCLISAAPPSPVPGQPEQIENEIAQPPSYEHAFVKMLLTLFGLIAMIFVTVWLLRRVASVRLQQGKAGQTIKIIERRPLSGKSALYLLEVDGKRVLVSESHLEVRALTSLERPKE